MRAAAVMLTWLVGAAVTSAGLSGLEQTQAPSRPGLPSPPQPAAPTPQTATARVSGLVTSGETGSPLRRAQILLRGGTPPLTRYTTSNDQGRYEVDALPPGRYTLSASKGGYVTLSYGQRRVRDTARPVEIATGQVLERVDFALPPGGVIVATVVDDFGEPISGVQVTAEQFRYVSGERQLAPVAIGALPVAFTDDQGQYRMHGLPPGEYYLRASALLGATFGAVDEQGLTLGPTFYPGTLSFSDARPVSISAGQEIAVTIPLVATRTARLGGRVVTSTGRPPTQESASLTQPGSGSASRTITLRPDGSFDLRGVIPGEYLLRVTPPILQTSTQAANSEHAVMPLTVTNDIADLVITTRPGGTLRGRLVFDTGPPADARPGSILLSLQQLPSLAGLPTGRTTWGDDWTFEVVGLAGPRLIRLAPAERTWALKRITLDNRDITDTLIEPESKTIEGIEVLLTRQRTSVSGTAIDTRGAPSTEYVAVIFASQPERWGRFSRFVGAAASDQNGRFDVSGLPPGDYLAAAVPALETGAENDPEVLERLASRAIAFTLADGASRALSLRIVEF